MSGSLIYRVGQWKRGSSGQKEGGCQKVRSGCQKWQNTFKSEGGPNLVFFTPKRRKKWPPPVITTQKVSPYILSTFSGCVFRPPPRNRLLDPLFGQKTPNLSLFQKSTSFSTFWPKTPLFRSPPLLTRGHCFQLTHPLNRRPTHVSVCIYIYICL